MGRPPHEAKFKGGKIINLNEKCYLMLSTNFKLLNQTQRNSINSFVTRDHYEHSPRAPKEPGYANAHTKQTILNSYISNKLINYM